MDLRVWRFSPVPRDLVLAQADPLSLPLLRVSSFVTLLHVFHKAKNGAQSTLVDDKELDVLRAYAELMFDEDHAGTVK